MFSDEKKMAARKEIKRFRAYIHLYLFPRSEVLNCMIRMRKNSYHRTLQCHYKNPIIPYHTNIIIVSIFPAVYYVVFFGMTRYQKKNNTEFSQVC